MTVEDFYAECEAHDWHYLMSDDSRRYERGHAAAQRLQAVAATDARLHDLYEAFQVHHFSGEAYGAIRAAKPSLWDWQQVPGQMSIFDLIAA